MENLKSEVIPGCAARFCLKSKETTEKTSKAKPWVKENEGGRLQVLAAISTLGSSCGSQGTAVKRDSWWVSPQKWGRTTGEQGNMPHRKTIKDILGGMVIRECNRDDIIKKRLLKLHIPETRAKAMSINKHQDPKGTPFSSPRS